MAEEKFSNFLTDIIDADLAEGKVDVVHTRFPPEPNGYLHIGSAKAIFINYTIAKHYGGLFNLRFDDTNPAREGDEYVQSILQDLHWLGADPNGGIYDGSDYFERCYEYAEQLIREGPPAPELVAEDGPDERDPAHQRDQRANGALVHAPAPGHVADELRVEPLDAAAQDARGDLSHGRGDQGLEG